MFGNALDIVNSKNWSEGQWLGFFKDRLYKMRAKRAPYEVQWKDYEKQNNAVSFYDNDGNLIPNIPLEKELKEIYMGRTEGKVNFDIVPDGQANIDELQPSKYALMFFLDGNEKDNFWKENKLMRDWKATYGSGIFFTGHRFYKDTRYVPKSDAELQNGTDIQNEANFDEIENETWFFHPKAIHPFDFFVDDAAYGQPDIQYADDCIYKEKLSAIDFQSRFGDLEAVKNIDNANYWVDITPKNDNDQAVALKTIVVYYYFHRFTKTFMIVANESLVLYRGKFLYNDGKLPFVNIQHYSRSDRFWGEGIPERVQYLKAYKSEIFTDLLSAAAMSSGLHLVVGNDDEIGQDWNVGGRQINLWRTTGGVDKVQQMNTTPNIAAFTNVMSIIDREIATVSGINPMDQFEPQSDKVGIVEIMEANKSVRNRSIDENYNIGLDEALTMMLDRIKDFAPALLSQKIKNKKGKTIKTIFPKITIKDAKVKQTKNEIKIDEDLGKYGYFELRPGVVKGVGVKIVTPSTNTTLPILERQKITEYVTNMQNLANLAALDQTGGMMKQLADNIKFDELMSWMNDAFGYDSTGLKAKTQKDKIKEDNLKKIEEIRKLAQLTSNAPTNVGPTTPETMPTGAPTAQGTPEQVGLPAGGMQQASTAQSGIAGM